MAGIENRRKFCGGRLVFPPGARKIFNVYRGSDRETGPKSHFELYQCPESLKKLRATTRYSGWPPQKFSGAAGGRTLSEGKRGK
jgi:hypothetical protein